MTTRTGPARGVEWRSLTGTKRHCRIAAITRRSTSSRTPRTRHAAVTSPRSSMRISTIANPWRPETSSPDRRGVNDLPRHLGVAADTASGRGFEVARRRVPGDGRLCRPLSTLRARASKHQGEPHDAPHPLIHAVFGHRMTMVGPSTAARLNRRRACRPTSTAEPSRRPCAMSTWGRHRT